MQLQHYNPYTHIWHSNGCHANMLYLDGSCSLVFKYFLLYLHMCISIFCNHLYYFRGSRSIGENIDRQMESMKSKRKVVRMFIAIVLIFAICWLPYHMFFIYAYHNNDITSAKYVQHMYLGFYWLAMSNAMVNPIIYYWMNKR